MVFEAAAGSGRRVQQDPDLVLFLPLIDEQEAPTADRRAPAEYFRFIF